MTGIKLCGLSRLQDIAAINALAADWAGFVLAPGSRRTVTAARLGQLRGQLRPDIKAVGVFQNQPLSLVTPLLRDGLLDIAQLHGQEDFTYVRRLRQQSGKPVIQAFNIRTAADLQQAAKSPADWVLLDAVRPGSGQRFDWSWLQSFTRPYFLAGGLTPANVAQAVRELEPFAVDVSSGIESRGQKDPQKMEQFVRAVRLAQQARTSGDELASANRKI
ncbi:MAG: phosphoribosylanthranilate isomerase [Oscillospiraceae bacterium]|nr:phosphoribosylanthranilate isomerase [Oscillospiraceae bacterium]MDD4368781.1 phosphoribosylanthranilate isomerase [Oscillospiraceae bacterium]